ncbi:MAG TPA: CRISPR-associated primase-polymerase type A1, partial [Myxococcota bacterium]|nr:CRISPR-associated primase-polymerase type A1 [Myxococcota bacterium]
MEATSPTAGPSPNPGLHDVAEHLRLADAAEEAGETGKALVEYNLALRDAPDRAEILLRIARLRVDRGELDRARRAYEHFLKLRPEDLAVAAEAREILAVPGVEAMISGVAPPVPVTGEPELAVTDADCMTFATLFAGREGVHARQWASSTGRSGYSPVREPFTAAVARGHLMGAFTVGIYPVRMDNTARFLAFDLDVAGAVRSVGTAFDKRLKSVHRAACLLVDACAALGIPTLLEDSGHKGRHVWVLMEHPVPAAGLRRLADKVLGQAGIDDQDVSIEVFPKQSRVAAGGLGNLIKLPLGVHRLTGRRSWFLDPATNEPASNPMGALAGLRRMSAEELRALVQDVPRLTVIRGPEPAGSDDNPAPGKPASTQPPRPREASTGPQPAALPQELPYDFDGDPQVQAVLASCPVLAAIVGRVRQGGVLTTDERIVLTHTLGHLDHGPDAVNHLLSNTLNIDTAVFLKSRLRGQPISCPRIRFRLKDVTAGLACDCRFDEQAGLYPTPVLHASPFRLNGRYPTVQDTPASPGAMQTARLESDLARAREQAQRAARLAAELEARLEALKQAPPPDQVAG